MVCFILIIAVSAAAESSPRKLDLDANSTGNHCQWDTDCGIMSACCNGPNGEHGTCWVFGTCDVYCDTDDHCKGDGTCGDNGKCLYSVPPTESDQSRNNNIDADVSSTGISCNSQNECPANSTCRNGTCWNGDSSSESPEHRLLDDVDADANDTGYHCKWTTDCGYDQACCNGPNGEHGTCWFAATCIPYCDTDDHCKQDDVCINGKCSFRLSGDSSTESAESLDADSNNLGSPEMLDADSNNVDANAHSSGMHCKWQTDCPDVTTCCNGPNGEHGTCWFGGSCDVYCDTDDHCVGQMTCRNGKCYNPYHPGSTESDQNGTNNLEADVNSTGISCNSQSDCPASSNCRNGTCWFGDSSTASPEHRLHHEQAIHI